MNELNRSRRQSPRQMRWALAGAICIALLAPDRLLAQQTPAAEPTDSSSVPSQETDSGPQVSDPPSLGDRKAEDSPGRVQYVGPDTYILLDAEGRPQPMPGMTYEDFMAAWRQTQNLEARSNEPRYSIEAAKFEGRSLDRHAELKVEFSIRIFTSQRVAVPLGLVGAILDGQPQFKRTRPKRSDDDASVEPTNDASPERLRELPR